MVHRHIYRHLNTHADKITKELQISQVSFEREPIININLCQQVPCQLFDRPSNEEDCSVFNSQNLIRSSPKSLLSKLDAILNGYCSRVFRLRSRVESLSDSSNSSEPLT